MPKHGNSTPGRGLVPPWLGLVGKIILKQTCSNIEANAQMNNIGLPIKCSSEIRSLVFRSGRAIIRGIKLPGFIVTGMFEFDNTRSDFPGISTDS